MQTWEHCNLGNHIVDVPQVTAVDTLMRINCITYIIVASYRCGIISYLYLRTEMW